MAHPLSIRFGQAFDTSRRSHTVRFREDPLDAARGIAFGTLASVLLWLPVAFAWLA
jgi:hypothetical protein